jgi:hypothetical protein
MLDPVHDWLGELVRAKRAGTLVDMIRLVGPTTDAPETIQPIPRQRQSSSPTSTMAGSASSRTFPSARPGRTANLLEMQASLLQEPGLFGMLNRGCLPVSTASNKPSQQVNKIL